MLYYNRFIIVYIVYIQYIQCITQNKTTVFYTVVLLYYNITCCVQGVAMLRGPHRLACNA